MTTLILNARKYFTDKGVFKFHEYTDKIRETISSELEAGGSMADPVTIGNSFAAHLPSMMKQAHGLGHATEFSSTEILAGFLDLLKQEDYMEWKTNDTPLPRIGVVDEEPIGYADPSPAFDPVFSSVVPPAKATFMTRFSSARNGALLAGAVALLLVVLLFCVYPVGVISASLVFSPYLLLCLLVGLVVFSVASRKGFPRAVVVSMTLVSMIVLAMAIFIVSRSSRRPVAVTASVATQPAVSAPVPVVVDNKQVLDALQKAEARAQERARELASANARQEMLLQQIRDQKATVTVVTPAAAKRPTPKSVAKSSPVVSRRAKSNRGGYVPTPGSIVIHDSSRGGKPVTHVWPLRQP